MSKTKEKGKQELTGPNYMRLTPVNMTSRGFLTLYMLHYMKEKGEPVYGVEIMNNIERVMGDSWQPSHGMLYPMLSELTDAKLISYVGRYYRKKYFTITPLGERELGKLLNEFKDSLLKSRSFFNNIVDIFYNNEGEDDNESEHIVRMSDMQE